MLLPAALGLALMVALLRGGRLSGFGQSRWLIPWVPPAALFVQVIAFLPDESASALARASAATLNLTSYLLIMVFVWANRRVPWIWLVGVGIALNALVIAANGGFMPIAPDVAAGTPTEGVLERGVVNNSVLLDHRTRLPFLADIYRLPEWIQYRQAFSLGDLLLAVGAFAMVGGLMHPRPSAPYVRAQ